MAGKYVKIGLLAVVLLGGLALSAVFVNPQTAAAQVQTSVSVSTTGMPPLEPGTRCVLPENGDRYHVHEVSASNGYSFLVEFDGVIFHSDTASCEPTIENPGITGGSVSGKLTYAPGESGTLTARFDTQAFNCGRVQYDMGFKRPGDPGIAEGEYQGMFFGIVVNYGKDCNVPVEPGPGVISVTSNIPTAWTVAGPQTFTGTGLYGSYVAAAGSYTLSNVPVRLIYGGLEYNLAGINDPTQDLGADASIAFIISYSEIIVEETLTAPQITQISNAECGILRLTWLDNSSNESGFRIYRSESENNGDYNQYQLVATLAANTTTYADRPALNRSYYYIVAAYSDALNRVAPSAPYRSAFNVPCLSNITLTPEIVAVNGQEAYDINNINDGDVLTIQILVDNTGPADAYVTGVTNQLSTTLRSPRNLTVTGPGAILGSPAITGTEPNVAFSITGRKPAGGLRWVIRFEATVDFNDDRSFNNCTTLNYFDDGGNKSARSCLGRVLGRTTGGGGSLYFREVAP